ncbi:MAG: helix-turn-helix domain-containing protein [Lachnospiraceae bacterium]|nr:helix-turn-helix domain-containing protein [Lachnospiraceae bacterium]
MTSNTVDLVKLGQNIKQAREFSKLTQTDLACFLDVDQSLISKIEKGERAISADALEQLASLLCFSVKDLIQADSIVPKGKVAFRTDGLTFDDNCILAKVNKIILNQIEMDGILYD